MMFRPSRAVTTRWTWNNSHLSTVLSNRTGELCFGTVKTNEHFVDQLQVVLWYAFQHGTVRLHNSIIAW